MSFPNSRLFLQPANIRLRYTDRADLNGLDILDIEEEYHSPAFNYMVGTVRFDSLFSLYDDRQQRLFVCVVG